MTDLKCIKTVLKCRQFTNVTRKRQYSTGAIINHQVPFTKRTNSSLLLFKEIRAPVPVVIIEVFLMYYWSFSTLSCVSLYLKTIVAIFCFRQILCSIHPPTKGGLEVCVFVFSFTFWDATLATKTMCTQNLVHNLQCGDSQPSGDVCCAAI